MPAIATSKNLTILGALTILAALVNAALALVRKEPVNLEVTLAAISTGIGFIMAKGQSNTGGTVAATPEAKERVARGFAGLPCTLALAGLCVAIVMACVGQLGLAAATLLLTLLLVGLARDPRARAVLLALAILFALPARGEDATPAPAPPPGIVLGTLNGQPVNLAFGFGLSGYAYDFGTKQVSRDVQFTGLAEVSVGTVPVALLAGAGFQTGENQGLAAQAGPEYRPLGVAVLFTSVLVGSTRSYGVAAGYVIRFGP